MSKNVSYHRIYDEASPEDGTRVLVDRVWPRGMRKEDAHLDEWMRDIAPSTELRHWYGHVPDATRIFDAAISPNCAMPHTSRRSAVATNSPETAR